MDSKRVYYFEGLQSYPQHVGYGGNEVLRLRAAPGRVLLVSRLKRQVDGYLHLAEVMLFNPRFAFLFKLRVRGLNLR